MNLADKFFEMDRTDAIRGLELYKVGWVGWHISRVSANRASVLTFSLLFLLQENNALNERLNAFFSSINNIGSMRGSVQFPTLQVRVIMNPSAASLLHP